MNFMFKVDCHKGGVRGIRGENYRGCMSAITSAGNEPTRPVNEGIYREVIKPSIVTAVALAVLWIVSAIDMYLICWTNRRDVCLKKMNQFLAGEAVVFLIVQLVVTGIFILCK